MTPFTRLLVATLVLATHLVAAAETSTTPTSSDAPANTVPGPASTQTFDRAHERFCLNHQSLALYHPLLNRRPTQAQRRALLANSHEMTDCIDTWKTHCSAQSAHSNPGLDQLCDAYEVATQTLIQNARDLASRKITHGKYNRRGQDVDNATLATETSLFKIAQDALDSLQTSADGKGAALDGADAARRQDEMTALLMQLNSHTEQPLQATVTDCGQTGGSSRMQCRED